MKVYNMKDAPDSAEYIGRPGPYGNPFIIGKDGNREEVIAKFAEYATAKLFNDSEWLEPLRGKDLACYCAPLACHGDVIIKYLEEKE